MLELRVVAALARPAGEQIGRAEQRLVREHQIASRARAFW